MIKTKTKTITIRCENCNAEIEWLRDELIMALNRIENGEHAACACDDDCAIECDSWSVDQLHRALNFLA